MGVTGLWDILAPAGKSRSLAHIAVVDGFEGNASDKRAYRVGIDASIWYKHATYSKEGENPELRLLFFRVKELARLPLLPLFVFDGRDRPKMKRGSKMGKSGSHNLSQSMKRLLGAFGMEWREAAGEAEAELAFLNRVGVIDAIMTDDVDAFVFGATIIIRNPSMRLSGNKSHPVLNLEGKESKHHVMEFRAETLRTHPEIGMTQGGMILFALLRGGDYDNGVDRFGKVIAHALARCGFGDELLEAVRNREVQSLHNFLPGWRHSINMELRENRRGFLKRTFPGLSIPDNFPKLDLLNKYVEPTVRKEGMGMRGNLELNLAQVASFCETFFEWGTRTMIIKRFRDLLWEASVLQVLRRAALEQDRREIDKRIASGMRDNHIRGASRPAAHEAVGTSVTLISKYLNSSPVDRLSEAFVNRGPSTSSQPLADPKSFIVKIHSSHRHVSADKILEYRLEVDPSTFVELTRSGIKDTRKDTGQKDAIIEDDGKFDEETDEDAVVIGCKRKAKTTKAPPDPLSTFRMWCPAAMLWRVDPRLVEKYERVVEEKKRKNGRRGTDARAPVKGKGKGKRNAASSGCETEASADEANLSQHETSPFKKRRTATAHETRTSTSDCVGASKAGPSRIAEPSSSQQTQSAFDNFHNHGGSSSQAPPSRASPSDAPGQLLCRQKSSSIIYTVSIPVLRTSLLSRTASNSSSLSLPTSRFSSTQSSARLSRTASGSSRVSGDGWDVDDGSSIFLYQIADPCDPDLVDRQDLRASTDRVQDRELVWSWTDLSSDVEQDKSGYENEDDLGLRDDRMDRLFKRAFMRKARATGSRFGAQLKASESTVGVRDKGKSKACNAGPDHATSAASGSSGSTST